MSRLRIALLRILYRIAWRGLQLRSLLLPGRGRGVKCLITHRGSVLLVRHSYGERDTWYVPGGRMHRREEPLQAAAREMREELGVEGLAWRELATSDLRLDRIEVRVTTLHAELEDPASVRLDPVELREAGWFDPSALPRPLGSEVRLLIALLGDGPES
jgi:8-oxo-dGTP pyrophosphatase MutT (NUDIX family)